MSGRLSATIGLYLLFLAVWSVINAIRGEGSGQAWRLGLALVWVALVAQATGAALGIAGEHRLDDPPTFWGYLAASVLILPLATARLGDVSSPTSEIAFAIVLAALSVVVWRLHVLWSAA